MNYFKFFVLVFGLLSFLPVFGQTKVSGQLFEGDEPISFSKVHVEPIHVDFETDFAGFFQFSTDKNVDSIQLLVRFHGHEELTDWFQITKGSENDLGKIVLTHQHVEEVTISHTSEESQHKGHNHRHHHHGYGETNYVGDDNDATLNVSDDVKKMSSMHVGHDHGDGNEVSSRGTPWDWNTILLEGERLPIANESGLRSLSLSQIPTVFVNYVDNSKVISSNERGDAIGGLLNIRMKEPADSFTVRLKLSAGVNFQSMKPLVNGAISISGKTKKKKFGYLIGLNANHRQTKTEAVQIDYFGDYDHSLRRLNLQNKNNLKTDYSAFAKIFWRPKPKFKLSYSLIGNLNTFKLNSTESRYNYFSSSLTSRHGFSNSQTLLTGGHLSAKWKITDKLLLTFHQSTYFSKFSYPRGQSGKGDARNGHFHIDFGIANMVYQDMIYQDEGGQVYYSDENGIPIVSNPSAVIGNLFRSKFLDIDQPGGIKGDTWDNIQPVLRDADRTFEFQRAFSEINTSEEFDPMNLRLDLQQKIGKKAVISYGAGNRIRRGKRRTSLHEWYQNVLVQNNPILLSDFEQNSNENKKFLTELDGNYQGYGLPFIANSAVESFLSDYSNKLNQIPMTTGHIEAVLFEGGNFDYSENHAHGFVQSDFKWGKWKLRAGLRYENVVTEVSSDKILSGPNDFYFANIYEGENGKFDIVSVDDNSFSSSKDPVQEYVVIYRKEKVTTRTKYDCWLPNLQLKFDPNKKNVLRLSATRTFRRPTYAELKPGAPVINYDQLEYLEGNPNLKPTFAWNIDASYELYMKKGQIFQFGIFYKLVEDMIFKTVAVRAENILGIRTKSYQNSHQNGHLLGAEFLLRKQFLKLPKFWKNFGVELNGAFSWSEIQIPGRNFKHRLPNQPSLLANAGLFFDDHDLGLFAQLTCNYTGGYLIEINNSAVDDGSGKAELLHANDMDYDRFMRARWEMNFYLEWEFKNGYSLFTSWNNLLNSPHQIYRGRQERVVMSSFDSIAGRIGLKMVF